MPPSEMKQILIVGAGKSATVLIEFLRERTLTHGFYLHVADVDKGLALRKLGNYPQCAAYAIEIGSDDTLNALVRSADITISLLPPALHANLAGKCLEYGSHYLNASYLNDDIRQMDAAASAAGLSFLCEMGLDPGIDHMSALSLIREIQQKGGRIHTFRSHCGGLVSPESDDNPWHYKISWNPRNIVMAGKDGAAFLEAGNPVRMAYEELFNPDRLVSVPGQQTLAWYPNRDSLPYIPLYGLEGTENFVRTTLRHPDFCTGWKNIVDLKLTDEQQVYDTDGMTLSAFFQIHFDRNGFSEWLQKTMADQFSHSLNTLDNLIRMLRTEQQVREQEEGRAPVRMLVDQEGQLQNTTLEAERKAAASGLNRDMHRAKLALGQLFFLGLDSPELINRGRCSAAEVLQWTLEKKLALRPFDKDMIVMIHEIGYTLGAEKKQRISHLKVTGKDHEHTAMARTVGIPLGIAALMLLEGKITRRGVYIPVYPDIYELVLNKLAEEGIGFSHHDS